ncbi:MAG: bifunctional GNAT family N-acetyltransferase/acetate--CoA ligase family protein, partial [Chloroflexota bacterium]|nr:bifunctional GNAT family N-acetyltransferase/acetate--CoA ligase family protein [Chloroflexota bacterium]
FYVVIAHDQSHGPIINGMTLSFRLISLWKPTPPPGSFSIGREWGREEKIVAVGRYYRLPRRDVAEFALVVEDAHQGRGIGTLLLEQLAFIARDNGIRFFVGEVLIESEEMMRVIQKSGFEVTQELEEDVYRIMLDLAPTPVVEERSVEREKIATIASMRAFLKPRSIAVIGASRRKDSVSNKLFRNLLSQGFNGVVYPVNPNTRSVASVRAYRSVLEIPDEIDLAVVVIPSDKVREAVEKCGRKGVRGVVVISAGFAEYGNEGVERQDRLVETTLSYGMRLVGPNCMGIINTDPDVNMNATFSSVFPPAGNVALGTQSGALGLAILEHAQKLNIGLSSFVSIGNRADVSSNDLLQYWEQDPATGVILLYLESFDAPRRFTRRRFARIARGVSVVKPVVAVKSGRTAAGSRAAKSHTGALAATEVGSDALFKQAGIIRVDTLEELFDMATLLAHQPIPKGNRVAILTNGGGPAILAADACAANGLELPSLFEKTIEGLKEFLPSTASIGNPIDMTATATAEQYNKALNILAQDPFADIVIVIFIPPVATNLEAVAAAISKALPRLRKRGKTVVASFMGYRGACADLVTKEGYCVPSFAFPESAALSLARAYEYREWLKRPKGRVPAMYDIDKHRAAAIVESAMGKNKDRPFLMDTHSMSDLLECYGIKVVQSMDAATPEEAASLAGKVGFPVVLKLLSDTIIHKTDVGGVALDLRNQAEVKRAFDDIRGRLESLGRSSDMRGVTVQKMVRGGVELIVGVTQDPSFGPLILFGMGGVYTELFKDVAFRIHPLTDVDAEEMVRSVNAYKLLKGWRGSPAGDVKAIEGLLLRVSEMIEDVPQIAELDLNPVKVMEKGRGYVIVDARLMLA